MFNFFPKLPWGSVSEGMRETRTFLQQTPLCMERSIRNCDYTLTNISHYFPRCHAFSCFFIFFTPALLSGMPFQSPPLIWISCVLKNQTELSFFSWVFSALFACVSIPCAKGTSVLNSHSSYPKPDRASELPGGDFIHTKPESCYWRIWFSKFWVGFESLYLKKIPSR